jgi:hypothetical protein
MADVTPEDIPPPPDSSRARRTPPTIDLAASDVSGETRAADTESQPEPPPQPEEPTPQGRSRSASSTVAISAVSGAVAAALVIAAASLAGWPGEAAPPTVSAPTVNSAAIDDLAARVTSVESKAGQPAAAAADPAVAARIEALEKSLTALRADVAGMRTQSEKLSADLSAVTSAPRENSPPPDLSGINDRLAQLERDTRAQTSVIAQQSEIAQENAKPADDTPLRRLVAAGLLDVLVRVGDPYSQALSAAKALAPDPDALKPLDAFAATGVPNAAVLSRELLALVPKLQPPMQEAATGTGIVARLQAGASKLVRVERTDAVGNDRGNVIARVTAAALRNEYGEARRGLNTLPPADRAAAQGWIEKADARDAALAVSRQFADAAMTALATPRQ